MSSRSSKHHESSSSKHSSKSKSKSKHKTDDWTEVAEPEERRRIQNRLAQRKFREKAKEQKEITERDSRNQEYADSSYRVAHSDELDADQTDVSGLPWGSISMRHVVARGHESESRRGSRRDDYTQDDSAQYYAQSDYYQQQQTDSYGSRDSSGGDDQYYEDQSSSSYYYYDYDHSSGDGSYQR